MKIKTQNDRKARIEMLPLIDIVFLLLVFFIYAMLSMAVHHGLPINLPVSSTVEIDKELILSLTINADGDIHLDKLPVTLAELSETVKLHTTGKKDPGILIYADSTLPYQKLFHILDEVKIAGISRISLQADKEK